VPEALLSVEDVTVTYGAGLRVTVQFLDEEGR
jgi:hypothetical protein